MAEPTTYPCLVCRSPAERIDSGTVSREWADMSLTTLTKRITWCPLCQTLRVQWVKTDVTDGGETVQRYIVEKIRREE